MIQAALQNTEIEQLVAQLAAQMPDQYDLTADEAGLEAMTATRKAAIAADTESGEEQAQVHSALEALELGGMAEIEGGEDVAVTTFGHPNPDDRESQLAKLEAQEKRDRIRDKNTSRPLA